MSAPTPSARVFRLPRMTYVVVLFLLVGSLPVAFTRHGIPTEKTAIGLQTLVLLVPIVAAFFVARTATVVTARGIVVRAAFGSRALAWDTVRGLSVSGNSVYAVLGDGSVRLPCVTVNNLPEVASASGGRLPQLPPVRPKSPPVRRRRR